MSTPTPSFSPFFIIISTFRLLPITPIFLFRTSLSGAPDWTAILVGFSSGAIKFFTENGVFLLAQVFHEGERVEKFKCFTSGTQGTMVILADNYK